MIIIYKIDLYQKISRMIVVPFDITFIILIHKVIIGLFIIIFYIFYKFC